MTLGWIVDSANDRRIDDGPPLVPPPPARDLYVCPFCPDRFLSNKLLLEHLADRHRGERPVMLIYGTEPVGLFRITAPLAQSDILAENCTSCVVSINGGQTVRTDDGHLRKILSSQRDALVDVDLFNVFDKGAQPLKQHYRLKYSVATAEVLSNIDRAFRRYLAVDAPSWTAIDEFLLQPCSAGVGRDYADALATYVRGILLKDRPSQVQVTLPYSSYRELYGQALEVLLAYRRPLSKLICAVIRFGRNDFSSAQHTVGAPLLDRASLMLAGIAKDGKSLLDDNAAIADGLQEPACPIDDGVGRILSLTDRLRKARHWSAAIEEECRQSAMASTLDAPDREKALALWAATALRMRAHSAAQEPLALLSATYPFDRWANRERERSALI